MSTTKSPDIPGESTNNPSNGLWGCNVKLGECPLVRVPPRLSLYLKNVPLHIRCILLPRPLQNPRTLVGSTLVSFIIFPLFLVRVTITQHRRGEQHTRLHKRCILGRYVSTPITTVVSNTLCL